MTPGIITKPLKSQLFERNIQNGIRVHSGDFENEAIGGWGFERGQLNAISLRPLVLKVRNVLHRFIF